MIAACLPHILGHIQSDLTGHLERCPFGILPLVGRQSTAGGSRGRRFPAKRRLFWVGSVSGKSAFFMDNFGFGRGFIRKKRNFVADVIFRTVRCVNCFSSCWPSRRACSFRRAACIRQQAPSAAFSAGDMHADEWQCERTYNSDLNHQPRVLREAESCPAQPSFRYGDRQVPAERAVVRGAASWGCGTGVAKLTAAFRTSDLSAGPHAVDYYVYRLRRLII